MADLHTMGFRQRYRFVLPASREALEERIRRQMRRNNPADLKLRRSNDRLILRFPSHTSSIWTPQIALRFEPLADGGTHVNAVIGPCYRVWRVFRTTLLVSVFIGLAGLAWSFIHWQMQGSAGWGPLLMVISLIIGLFLYFVNEEGRRRSNDERNLLMTFMDDALEQDLFLVRKIHARAPALAPRTATVGMQHS